MPGKYSHLKNSLTKFTPEPEYQERVNFTKDKIKNDLKSKDYPINAKTLGGVYDIARAEKDRLESLVKEQNLVIAAMEQELVDLLEDLDFTSVKLQNGISLTIKDDVYVTVKDKDTFMSWIDEQELQDLLSVNYQTMAALVKTCLVEGKPIPPGTATYFKQSITRRGGND